MNDDITRHGIKIRTTFSGTDRNVRQKAKTNELRSSTNAGKTQIVVELKKRVRLVMYDVCVPTSKLKIPILPTKKR